MIGSEWAVLAGLLPFLGLAFLLWISLRNQRSLAEAVAVAFVIWFLFVAIVTELLSAAGWLTRPAVLLVWSAFLILLVLRWLRREEGVQFLSLVDVVSARLPDSIADRVLVGFTVLILGLTLATAWLYPPNTWDSMTYHMPRVMHWIANRSVEFYPTAIERQNYQMPLAEYGVLHLQLLSGGDRWANLVQWVAFASAIVLGAGLAAELGMGERQQRLAAAIIAATPMAILQASSTQNDLVASALLMAFAYALLRLRRDLSVRTSSSWILTALAAACALGLALLTKGSAYLFAAAMGLALFLPILADAWRRPDLRPRAMAAMLCISLIALILSVPFHLRTVHAYGRPLATGEQRYGNEQLSVRGTFDNAVRNAALHLDLPSANVNWRVHQTAKALSGDRLDDPATTWPGESFFVRITRHEDHAGNAPQLMLGGIVLLILPAMWWSGRRMEILPYSFGLLLGALLFCTLLRWQPWASRLHTPLFLLAAPIFTVPLHTPPALRRLSAVGVFGIVLYALPYALDNDSRSLLSQAWRHQDRFSLYFVNRPALEPCYRSIGRALAAEGDAVYRIGLRMDLEEWEYPLWVELPPGGGERGPTIEHASPSVARWSERTHRFGHVVDLGTQSEFDQELPGATSIADYGCARIYRMAKN